MWIELTDELEASVMINLDNVLTFRPRPNGAGTEIRLRSSNVDLYVRDNYLDVREQVIRARAGRAAQYA